MKGVIIEVDTYAVIRKRYNDGESIRSTPAPWAFRDRL